MTKNSAYARIVPNGIVRGGDFGSNAGNCRSAARKVACISVGGEDATVGLRLVLIPKKPDVITNSLGMTFKLIPSGTFAMGSPTDELGRQPWETQHQVTLTKVFYMQTTEVTQEQWKNVMGDNPSAWSYCGLDCPVESVSWNSIQSFISALNQFGEGVYRLPTEAEWEYACRAGSTTAFANGNITNTSCSDPNLYLMGWYCGNSGYITHSVATKQPNQWGLYDMHGNVWEFCSDFWQEDYPTGPVTDPTGPGSRNGRVFRGGSYDAEALYNRSAARSWMESWKTNSFIGFRLVLIADE